LIEQVLSDLKHSSLLSDLRFAEAYVESRVRKGQGPVRIRMALREKGISAQRIDELLESYTEQWYDLMIQVHDAKYGQIKAESNTERAKRARFLESRGFPSELIRACLFEFE
jgi:regulatory protein